MSWKALALIVVAMLAVVVFVTIDARRPTRQALPVVESSVSAQYMPVTGVQGVAGDGDTAKGHPVQVGGVDSAGLAQALRVNSIGQAQVAPFAPILEIGVTELITINETIAQYDWTAVVTATLATTHSGEILAVALYATEDDAGAIVTEAGVLIIADASLLTSAADANLGAAIWPTILGVVDVANTEWFEENSGQTGAIAYIVNTPIPFHEVSSLRLSFYHTGATTWNDGATDDEQLEVNIWYRRDS